METSFFFFSMTQQTLPQQMAMGIKVYLTLGTHDLTFADFFKLKEAAGRHNSGERGGDLHI